MAAVDGKQGEPLPICEGESIPSYVAKKRESVRFGDVRQVSSTDWNTACLCCT